MRAKAPAAAPCVLLERPGVIACAAVEEVTERQLQELRAVPLKLPHLLLQLPADLPLPLAGLRQRSLTVQTLLLAALQLRLCMIEALLRSVQFCWFPWEAIETM